MPCIESRQRRKIIYAVQTIGTRRRACQYYPEVPLEETLRALDDLVTQGKVLYVGVSEWSATQIADAVYTARELNLDRIVSNQPIYNMLQRYIERNVLPLCEREGIGQVVF